MKFLTLRTDKPEAEIGLYEDEERLAYETWTAHRQLAETLHMKIAGLLEAQRCNIQDLDGIISFTGPGSFTGLRIGLSVANALAYSLSIPIAGEQSSNSQDWRVTGIRRLLNGNGDQVVMPEYGAPVHITPPKSR